MSRRTQSELIEDLAQLYELSLSIGRSLDLRTCCDGFLKALLARKGLAAAVLWERDLDGGLRCIYANPSVDHGQLVLDPGHRIARVDQVFEVLPPRSWPDVLDGRLAVGEGIAFQLADFGVLLLLSVRPGTLGEVQCRQLVPLVHMFAVSVSGCLSHRRLDEEKRRSELLALVAAHTENSVVVTDAEGRIEWVNRSFEQLTGFSRGAAIGQKPGHLLQGPDTDPEAVERIRRAVRAGAPANEELLNYTRAGRAYWVSLSITPIRDGGGRTVRFIAVQRETTRDREQREALMHATRRLADQTQALERARTDAERASEQKSSFLARTSHEIRTPMTAIVGYADLLERGEGTEEQRRAWVSRIRDASRQLLDLAGGVLDLARIEKGPAAAAMAPVRVGSLVDEVGATLEPEAGRKGLGLTWQVPPDLPDVTSDARAIRYTARGHVRITAERAADGAIDLCVEDTGVGIPREQIEGMFQPFVRLQREEQSSEGFGLGLAISHQLALSIGAQLLVESTPGTGSTFRLRVPGAVAGAGVEALTARGSSGASDPDGRPFATPDLRGRRVLLAEDTPDIREILEAFVSRTGAETDVVCDGAEAVERVFLAQAEGRPYDVVLMDLKMPVMDGFEATERLRASGFARPVIALTAFVLGEDADRALRAGCNARLTKPVTSADLYQELERHLAGRETSADGTR
ncbi:MAG: response regulator [Planctomycetota bacterium]|nr:response regulator [Planctomycetota bacterium]